MAATTKNFEVAIVGGGLAGVALCHALHSRNIPAQLYEKNSKFDEFGAGLTMMPNAVQALHHISSDVYESFKATGQIPSDGITFKVFNGMTDSNDAGFPMYHKSEMGGIHRSHFLEEMARRLPKDFPVHFGKNLDNIITDEATARQRLIFTDGSTALADVVVGADGLGSHVRRVMYGKDHPCVRAKYSGSYMYRVLVPMEKAAEHLGKERAFMPSVYAGTKGEIIMYPLEHNTMVTIAAMYEDDKPWPDAHHTLRRVKRAEMERDYQHWNSAIRNLIAACDDDVIAWGLFDTANDPVPTYVKGRILLLGDSAHATCPNMASGAGFAMEDVAVLADLLAQDFVSSPPDLDMVLAAFNDVRVPRGKYLVQGSRTAQKIWGMQAPGVGSDMRLLEKAIRETVEPAWNVDFDGMLQHARGVLSIKRTIGLD